jgi:hypothetical protein
MSDAVLIGNNGIPAMRVTSHTIFNTIGSDAPADAKKTKETSTTPESTFPYSGKDYVYWGGNNRFPDDAELLVHDTGVLQTALNFKARCCYGQGVIPVIKLGFDENFKEKFKPLNDVDALDFIDGYTFQNYHTSSFRDLTKFGNCFPLLVPNNKGDKIVRIDALNARHCRMSKDKTKLLVYGDFCNNTPGSTTKDVVVYDMLDETDPQFHLDALKATGKFTKPMAFPRIRNYQSNNDYYARTDWWSVKKSGWLKIAHQIPKFLEAAYRNAITCMWHVKVPVEFYNRVFPEKSYKNLELRLEAIKKWQDEIDKNLTGVENANKSIFTEFHLNESGKAEEQVVIDKLDNKMNFDDKLATSAAANSEILFSLMVNPSILGAGMPGGPYAGNAGSGSDIREGLMVSLVLSYIEKQQVLNPVKLMFRFNGYKNIDFKYRNIVLTTLDKGKSTEETIQ